MGTSSESNLELLRYRYLPREEALIERRKAAGAEHSESYRIHPMQGRDRREASDPRQHETCLASVSPHATQGGQGVNFVTQ